MENKQDLYSNTITRANMLCVSTGAILGSASRIFCFLKIPEYAIINIIIINLIGSVAFAVISQFENIIPKNLKLFLLTGFCASFTTFSITIGQAHVCSQALDLKNYSIALFGNFFICVSFTIIAILITNKIFKTKKGLN